MIQGIQNISRREKIIIGLMILAILYGLFEFLTPSASDTDNSSSGGNAQEFNQMVTVMAQAMTGVNLSQAEKYVIATAQDKWTQDPFSEIPFDSIEESEDTDLPEAEEQITKSDLEFTYSGFLIMGDRKIGIINGLEFEKGDELESGLYTVQEIDPEKVALRDKKSAKVIIVPIKDKIIEGKTNDK